MDTVAPAAVIVVTPKPWYKSKTILANIAIAVLMVLEAKFALLQPYIPGNIYAYFAVALPVINTALRVITTAPVTA